MMKTSKLIIAVSLMCIIVLATQSCSDNALYDSAYSFKGNEWQKSDTASFYVDVTDSITNYDFILSLRTTKDYLYSNLWVHIMITSPDQSTSKVAQKIPLAKPDGSWIGKVSGSLVESRLRFDAKNFPIKGQYLFQITNATQEEVIEEVVDIGLRIE